MLTPLLPQHSPLPPQNSFSNACYSPFLDSSVSLHGPWKVHTSLPGMPGLQRAAPPSLNITHRPLPSPLGSTHRTTPGGKPLCSFFPLSLFHVSAMLFLLPGTLSPGAVQTQLKYCHPRKLAFTPSPQQDQGLTHPCPAPRPSEPTPALVGTPPPTWLPASRDGVLFRSGSWGPSQGWHIINLTEVPPLHLPLPSLALAWHMPGHSEIGLKIGLN